MTHEGNLAFLSARAMSTLKFYGKAVSIDSAIVLSWLWLNLPALQWISQAVTEISTFNRLLLIAGGLLLVVQAIRYRQMLRFSAVPMVFSAPLFLLVGCGVTAIAVRWLIALEQIPVLLFILGTYGLLGLFLAPTLWRRGLAVAIAIACILPFGIQFTTGLGFPTRILTAHTVEEILKTWNIAALSSEDIIVLDTGIAHIDLPCSGLKSLWTGSLFLLAATWLEGRQMGWRWLLVCVANLGLLTIANIARVLTLVILVHVFQQPQLADIIHVPLGVASFVTVCIITWAILRFVPRHQQGSATIQNLNARTAKMPGIAQALLVGGLLAMSLLPQPISMTENLLEIERVQWSALVQTQPIDLNPVEQNFFANYPNVVAQKQHFQFRDLSGEIVLVSSNTWQAHHAPELCFVSSGLNVSHMEKQQLTPDVMGRWLSLNGGMHSATYWFQSPKRTTDEFLDRIWGEVSRQDSSWTLVSVLFDRSQLPTDPQVQQFLNIVHSGVNQELQDS